MMTLFISGMAILNLLGGRNLGGENIPNEKLIFRAFFPALAVLVLCSYLNMSIENITAISAIVLLGSLLWAAPNWSFEEIHGIHDPTKYPKIIRQIGYAFFPLNDRPSKARGVIMKGLRGFYEFPMYVLLSFFNPLAAVYGLNTFFMGAVYWFCGKITPEKYAVAVAEFVYGAWRGLWIYLVIASIK